VFKKKVFKALFSVAILSFSSFSTLSAEDSTPPVVNLLLKGGADMRQLFVPPPSEDKESYGYWFWFKRGQLLGSGNSYSEQLSYYSTNYDEASLDGVRFGVLKSASWLKSQIDLGRVAILSGMRISDRRNSRLSLLRYETGSETVNFGDKKSGWGGRLASAVGKNIVSLSKNQRLFCELPENSNSDLISLSNSRNFGLYEAQLTSDGKHSVADSDILARALKSYYSAKREELSTSSPLYRVFTNEKVWRKYRRSVIEGLQNYPLPSSIERLYSNDGLNSSDFGIQIRNLHDALTLKDELNIAVVSMEYLGWNSYSNQKSQIEPKLSDIFGENGGFATLGEAIENDFTLIVGSESGRQLSENGSLGTDLGDSSIIIVIGSRVGGGLYGELFPESDIDGFQRQSSSSEAVNSYEKFIESLTLFMGGDPKLVVPDSSNRASEKGFSTLFK
jgi:hypothetical protein